MSTDLQSFRNSVVRIYSPKGKLVGFGYRLSGELVLTCAHIVARALNIDPEVATAPCGNVLVEIVQDRGTGSSAGRRLDAAVEVQGWFPPGRTGELSNLAVLGLDPPVPPAGPLVSLSSIPWDRGLDSYCFAGVDESDLVPLVGAREGVGGGGRMQVAVRRGDFGESLYDGAPAVDEQSGRVIGLIVQDQQDQGYHGSYLIPADELREALRLSGVEIGRWEPRLSSIRSWAEKMSGRLHLEERDAVLGFIDHYSTRIERPVPFAGRGSELAELDEWWRSDGNSLFVVRGPAGVGKSALLLHWLERLLVGREDLELLWVPVSSTYGTNDEVSGVQLLHAQLLATFGELAFPEGSAPDPKGYREKLHQGWELMRNSESRYLLVIDGVDEVIDPWLFRHVLPSEVPENLSIVLSMREEREGAACRALVEELTCSGSALTTRTLKVLPLEQQAVREVLTQLGHPIDDGRDGEEMLGGFYRLTEEGDPLLVSLWANELWGRWGTLPDLRGEDLAGRLPGFEGFLEHWRNSRRELWGHDGVDIPLDEAERLLSVLAFAEGPLRLSDLIAVARRLPPGVRWDEQLAQQILEGASGLVVDYRDGVGYSFGHDRLRTEFLARAEARGLQRSAIDQAILGWGAETVEGLISGRLRVKRCPVYLLRHYTSHVARSGLAPSDALEKHLLALLAPQWRNAWGASGGSHSGFLRDLALVESVAQEVGRETESRVCSLCELIRASLDSVKGASDAELIETLVQSGLWTLERGLRAIGGFPDRTKATLLRNFVQSPAVPLSQETLELVYLISKGMVRSQSELVVKAVAELLQGPAGQVVLPGALAAVERADDAVWCVQALLALADHTEGQARREVLKRTLEASEGIDKGWQRAEVLVALAAYMEARGREGVLGRALEASEGVEEEWLRAEALSTVVGPLSEYPELLARALGRVEKLESSLRRTRVLMKMGLHLERNPERLAGSLVAVEQIESAEFRAEALAFLAAQMAGHPELLLRVLELAQNLEADRPRGKVLAAVGGGSAGHREVLQRTMVALEGIKDAEVRVRTLSAMVGHLEDHVQTAVLEEALSLSEGIESEEGQVGALLALATLLKERPVLLERARRVAEGIERGWLRRRLRRALNGEPEERMAGYPSGSVDAMFAESEFEVRRLMVLGARRVGKTRYRAGLSYEEVVAGLAGEGASKGRRRGGELETARAEPVHATTVSPGTVKPGARFLVAVVLHVEGFEVAASEDTESKEDVAVLALREGVVVTVRLAAVDDDVFSIDDPEARLLWGPPSRRVEFRVRGKEELADGIYDLRVEFWYEGVQLARSYLEIVVDSGLLPGTRVPGVGRTRIPSSVFASYSSRDRVTVVQCASCLKTAGIEVFVDCLDIRQAALWEEVLELELLTREKLFLFWSSAAKESEWVEKEWRFALKHRGLDFIVPNALEPPSTCEPPEELKKLQFGQAATMLVQYWAADGSLQ